MFLFKSDEQTHGGIYDFNTKNKSAVRMALMYKKMGIKNCNFLLYLSQPDLVGVDPYNIHGSEELAAKIALEIKLNPFYYAREVVKVQNSGSDPIPFIFNRFNVALFWVYLNSIDIQLTAQRQAGKSVSTIILESWIFFFVVSR